MAASCEANIMGKARSSRLKASRMKPRTSKELLPRRTLSPCSPKVTGRGTLIAIQTKQGLCERTLDFCTVGKNESLGLAALDAQTPEYRRGDHRIVSTRINQEFQAAHCVEAWRDWRRALYVRPMEPTPTARLTSAWSAVNKPQKTRFSPGMRTHPIGGRTPWP
jgi:hypothetical protein